MPKPDETNIGGKLGIPGIGEFSVSQKFASKDFYITSPNFDETNKQRVYIRGLGAKKGWRILLMNEVLGSGCYLQDDIGEPTTKGEWKVLAKLSASGSERIIYALAIKEKDVATVIKILAQSNKIKTISEAERILEKNKVTFQISIGKSLIYNSNETPSQKSAVAERNTLFHEKNESMAIGLKIPDGIGGLFSGTYKTLYLSEKNIGKILNISVESSGHPLCIEFWQTAYDGADANEWLSKRKHVKRSLVKPNPDLSWEIIQSGAYTIYFVTHSPEGKKADFHISYQVELMSD